MHYPELVTARNRLAKLGPQIGVGRTAILTWAGVDYGVMRQFEMLGTGTVTAEVTVFTDEAEARAWLRTRR